MKNKTNRSQMIQGFDRVYRKRNSTKPITKDAKRKKEFDLGVLDSLIAIVLPKSKYKNKSRLNFKKKGA